MNRQRSLFWGLILLVTGFPGAQELRINGSAGTQMKGFWFGEGSPTYSFSGRLFTRGTLGFSQEGTQLFLSGDLGASQENGLQGELHTGGIRMTLGDHYTLSAGRLRMLLGLGTQRAPGDLLNPLEEKWGYQGVSTEWTWNSDFQIRGGVGVDRLFQNPGSSLEDGMAGAISFRGRGENLQFEALLSKAAGNRWRVGGAGSVDLWGLITTLEVAAEGPSPYLRPFIDPETGTSALRKEYLSDWGGIGQIELQWIQMMENGNWGITLFGNYDSRALLGGQRQMYLGLLPQSFSENIPLPTVGAFHGGGEVHFGWASVWDVSGSLWMNMEDGSVLTSGVFSWIQESGWGCKLEIQGQIPGREISEFGQTPEKLGATAEVFLSF